MSPDNICAISVDPSEDKTNKIVISVVMDIVFESCKYFFREKNHLIHKIFFHNKAYYTISYFSGEGDDLQ